MEQLPPINLYNYYRLFDYNKFDEFSEEKDDFVYDN